MEQQLCLKFLFNDIVIGILLVLTYQGCGGKSEVEHEEVPKGSEIVFVTDPDRILEGPIVSCPQQIINIKDGGLLFLKLGIQYDDLSKPDADSVLIPRYLDGVIQVASEYTSAELSKESGKEKLKEALLVKLNELANTEATISKIYFETLLVR